MNVRFILTVALVLTTVAHSAIFEPLEQDCVLGIDGHQICNTSPVISELDATSRMRRRSRRSRRSSPCKRTDVVCWSKMVLAYLNHLRAQKGLSKMSLGPKTQMANAMRYAKKLSKMGYLKHQDLRAVTKEVGCKHWVGGENLAFNYEAGDIAKKCMDQWITSKGHYQNLVRAWFKEMVVGFHFDKDGRVYCVQTFSLYYPKQTFGRRNGPKCGPVA